MTPAPTLEGVPRAIEVEQALLLIELFARAALDDKGLGERACIQAIHELVKPLVPNPVGYDQIALADRP